MYRRKNKLKFYLPAGNFYSLKGQTNIGEGNTMNVAHNKQLYETIPANEQTVEKRDQQRKQGTHTHAQVTRL